MCREVRELQNIVILSVPLAPDSIRGKNLLCGTDQLFAQSFRARDEFHFYGTDEYFTISFSFDTRSNPITSGSGLW